MNEISKQEKNFRKNINQLAKESALTNKSSVLHSQALIDRNQAELEQFCLLAPEEEESLNFALDLMADVGLQLFDEDSIALMDAFKKRVLEKSLAKDEQVGMKDVFGIKQEKIEAIYELGSILYEGQLYMEARSVFLLLINLDPYFTNAWIALALSLQGLNEFEKAIRVFSYLTLYNNDPDIYIHAIRCCIQGNKLFEAKLLLNQVERLPCTHEQREIIKQIGVI